MMNYYHIYHDDIPDFLQECSRTPEMKRLRQVGMNCGCEYTSFEYFKGLAPYSRFDHSLGVALIVWHFTRSPAQAVAGLLHDIATPVFAHVVDFLHGDYLSQESTEKGTRERIENSAELQTVLEKYALKSEDVCDYHKYPVADNDSPRLSADRLEYTLGNALNFGFLAQDEISSLYDDLVVGQNEEGVDELMFRHREMAETFAMTALRCSKIYVSDEDRYAMQILSEILRHALEINILLEKDLHTEEPDVIAKLAGDPETGKMWNAYCGLHQIFRSDRPLPDTPDRAWRKILAKKRCIDPMVEGEGRVSHLSPAFAQSFAAFQMSSQEYWISAERRACENMTFSMRDENGFTPEEAKELKRRITEIENGNAAAHSIDETCV